MKRTLLIFGLIMLLFGCEYLPPEYVADYALQVVNDTTYTIDVKVGEVEIDALAPGDTSAIVLGQYVYLEGESRESFPVLIAENGYPLLQRGKIYLEPGDSILMTVYFDFYDNEYHYTLTIE